MQKVEKKAVLVGKEYKIIGKLENDIDAILSFEEELSNAENEYFCDILNDVADSYVPIYNYELWKNAHAIKENIEDGIVEFSLPPKDFSLESVFSLGYYHYFRELLDDNLTTIIYNLLAKRLNELFTKLSDESIKAIERDLEPIENALEEAVFDVLNEDKISYEIINEAVQPIFADTIVSIH